MRSLTVTLPDDIVEAIEAKVAAGEYASESDVVRDSVETLMDFELDEKQIAEIRASYDHMKADPSLGIPIDQVMDRVRKRVLGSN